MSRFPKISAALAGILVVAGCATMRPGASNETDVDLRLSESDCHPFTYVRVHQEGAATMLYGKVEHRHDYCTTEAYVDMALAGPDGQKIRTERIPLRASGTKQSGWYEADFRTQFAPVLVRGSQVVLSSHDDRCEKGRTSDCKQDRAVKNPSFSIPRVR